jgi:hypothetical protein
MLKGVAQRAFPGGEVVVVDSDAAVRAEAARADLLLINRQLDGDFQVGSGLDLIGALVPMQGRRAAVMLVSNFAEAQAQARALGASRGFGKAKAGSDDAAAAMREAVARAQGCGREARGSRAGMTDGEEPARGGNSGPQRGRRYDLWKEPQATNRPAQPRRGRRVTRRRDDRGVRTAACAAGVSWCRRFVVENGHRGQDRITSA